VGGGDQKPLSVEGSKQDVQETGNEKGRQSESEMTKVCLGSRKLGQGGNGLKGNEVAAYKGENEKRTERKVPTSQGEK